uniref:Uncharacterized protein n=1 Tax=Clastoptera arizonana TaxID=38151 RepID=A0A1B6E134_9HEMI
MDSLNMIQYLENTNDVDLLCPYCDEIIELFNNNLDFSINLHSQNVFHKEAYRKFQEFKATEILDEKTITKQKELETLNQILQKMAMGTMSISFPNVDQNILAYSTLKSTLNLEEPSEALKKLFINFREGYKYNIHFIVQEETKLSCKLCSCYISITNDEIQQIHFLKTHLEGNYHKTNIEKFLKSLPKNDFDDKYYFKLIPGNIFCKLCNVMTPISMSGLESTCGDLQLHLIDREHKRGEVKYLEEYESVRQIFNYEVPELVNKNRFYLIKVGESFKCSLCNMFIIKDETEASENVLRHLNSISHGKKYAIRLAIIENPIMDFISPSSDVEVLKEKIKPFKSKVIDHNLMFVSRLGQSNFKCNLCNIELFSSTVKIWPDHFNGLFHTQNKAILLSKQRLITFEGNDSNLSRCITIGKYFYRPKNGATTLNETKQSLKCDKTGVHTKIPNRDFTLPKTSSSQNFTGPIYNSDRLKVVLEKYDDPVFF